MSAPSQDGWSFEDLKEGNVVTAELVQKIQEVKRKARESAFFERVFTTRHDELVTKVSSLKSENGQLKIDNEKLTRTIEAAIFEADASKKVAEKSDNRARQCSIEHKLTLVQLVKSKREFSCLLEDYKKSEKDVEKIKEIVGETGTAVRKLRKYADDVVCVKNGLEISLEETKKKHEGTKEELKATKEELKKTKKNLEETKKKLEETEKELKETKKEVTSLQWGNHDLVAKNHAWGLRYTALMKEVKTEGNSAAGV